MSMRHVLNMLVAVAVTLLLGANSARADVATPDDTAHILAGMQPAAASPLLPFTQDAAWQRHQRFFDGAFGQLEQRQLSKVRNWADVNLAAPRPTMFYFFSGPDFLYADAFYGKATTYVMAALEPSGPVPDLTRLPRGSIGPALSYVERSLSSILNFSFFITKQMKVDLHEGEVNGTLPVLYVFLARTGKTIRSTDLIWLDANGAVHGINESPQQNATRGARIVFAGKDGIEKTLYYFSTDLSNSGVKSSGFFKFCEPLGPGNSLLKSASYLLHSGTFASARSWLLAHSATIIQDDSGIPLGSYDRRGWRFFPFGRYAGPISQFAGMYQGRYADLFEHAPPLDFGIGYRWHTRESNLLLSVRTPGGDGSLSAEATPPPEQPYQPTRPRRVVQPPPAAQPRGGFWFWDR